MMKELKLKYSNYKKWLWSNEHKEDSFFTKFIRNILQITSALICDLKEGQLSLRAMSLVYTTIISIVPLFAISFSLLKGLGAHNQIRPFLINALEPLGDKGIEISNKIITFVDNIQVGVLGTLGIVILIYTVIGMMQKIELSFNYVWHISKSRSFGKRFNDYLSALIIGPLLIFTSTAMAASTKSNFIIDKLNNIAGVDLFLTLVGVIIPYLILVLAFTFLYSFVPNTKVNWKSAFIGGLMTAFTWKIMGWGFANFVANSASHTAIYSAFATIILFIVWIYLVWLVLLIGASISFYNQHPEYRKIRHNSLKIASAKKEAIALQIMIEIGKRFVNQRDPAEINDLSKISGQSKIVTEEIIQNLKHSKLILTEEDSQNLFPALPIENISIYDIISAVRNNNTNNEYINISSLAKKYERFIDSSLKDSFQNITLQKLINEN